MTEFNLAEVHEAIATVAHDRECIVYGTRHLTWAEVTDRTRRLANFLLSNGVGGDPGPDSGRTWESSQDHIALYLFNGNEYLESMLGAFKARAVPFNVNYRYVQEELRYLLADGRPRAIIFHSSLAATLAAVLDDVPRPEVLIQVADPSGAALLPGAVDYEAAISSSSSARPDVAWSPEDLYILYTGGTTGMPKGVLWRQSDLFAAALGGSAVSSLAALQERVASTGPRVLPASPFMHGAAHWAAFNAFHNGGTVIIPAETTHLDLDNLLETIERERAEMLVIIGDAFAMPLVDAIASGQADLSSLRSIVTGGATLGAPLKDRLLSLLPGVAIADVLGASETGNQGNLVTSAGTAAATGVFSPSPNTVVLSDDRSRLVEAGETDTGWLAQRGPVPLGYLDDEAKTRATFPEIEGVRYSVPGDRARLLHDGTIELLGRDSVSINTGGEKVFVEEVELALRHHPAVYDVVVVGRPSERWGNEVVALVQLREGNDIDDSELLAEASTHIARYKLPKAIIRLDHIVRSPSGKPDYRWARDQAARTVVP